MIPTISLTVIHQPADVSIRAWRRAKREAHEIQGVHWQQKFSGRHFKRGARSRYGYQPRTRKYQAKKRRLAKAGAIPRSDADLVFTGNLRRAARLASIRGYPSRVQIEKNMPRYVTRRPRGRQPSLVDEQLRVLDSEGRELTDVLDVQTHARLERHRSSGYRTRRFK